MAKYILYRMDIVKRLPSWFKEQGHTDIAVGDIVIRDDADTVITVPSKDSYGTRYLIGESYTRFSHYGILGSINDDVRIES